MLKQLLPLSLLFCIFAFTCIGFAQNDKTEAEKWREDLRFMAREMEERHKDLFHTISREKFQNAVRLLDAKIPELERHQIIVEVMRIVAMVGDGHTNIYPTRDAVIAFRRLPVQLLHV